MDSSKKLSVYDRESAVFYARKWALNRNKSFADFEDMGGDCTNYASQVIHAGGCPMNHGKQGWYYKSLSDRAPAWTSVEYLYKFLVNNQSVGPVAEEVDINAIAPGDIIQLNFGLDHRYDHSPVVVKILPGKRSLDKILIAAHSIDRLDYPTSNYIFKKIRFLHIKGYRK